MKAPLRWLAGNVLLIVLALMLAVLAWFVAVESENPTRTGRYQRPIAIKLSGLPEGMILLKSSQVFVNADVRTTESVWEGLSLEDFSATADLTGLGPGVHEVPVRVELAKQPARVLLVEPRTITVELEHNLERVVQVRVEIEGEPALGYLRRAPATIPREVTVNGPASRVNRVAEAIVRVSVEGASTDVGGGFLLTVQDDDGQPVSLVTLSPDTVDVRIPIELSGYYRPLAVKIVLEGQVANNYRITGISVDPPTITVFGTPNVISALPGYIETEPISVEGAIVDLIQRPRLNLPANVSLVTGEKPVEVRVLVEAILGSKTVDVEPTLQGLGPGLTATLPLKTLEVIVSGPLPVLETLGPDDVRVILDLFGLSVGKHEIDLQVVLPEGVEAQNIFPASMQIEILAASTPTP